jgi:uncharacterized protein (DUF1015 family)
MPRFEPFTALRFNSDLPLEHVTAPPYDVLSNADVDALIARHEANVVRVDVPREQDGPGRYDAAAALLNEWIAAETLVLDDTPTFTLYRMRFTDEAGNRRETVGVLGALEVVDEGGDGVLPHERTTPKAKTDRLDLTRATRTNMSPVWGLSLTAGLTDLLLEPAEPVGSFVNPTDGVEHIVERVTDAGRIAAIAEAVGASPVLIADGHHRYAISRTYRDERRAVDGDNGTSELTLTYVAELVADQLSIDAIHRLYTNVSAEQLLELLAPSFDTSEAGPVDAAFASEVVARAALCLVRPDGTGVWLHPRSEVFADVRALDGAYLEHALAGADVDVTYQHGVQHVVDMVRDGEAAVGVLIRPTSIVEIRRTADERLLMPPKSTFFTPKLRTGLLIRPLD